MSTGTMKIICMWCEEEMGEKDDEGSGAGNTMSCCEKCLRANYPPDVAEAVIAAGKEREVKEQENKRLVA